MIRIEEEIAAELARFRDDAARMRFNEIRVPSRLLSLQDVFAAEHKVLTIAEVGPLQIVFRLAEVAERWGIVSEGTPVADFDWYRTLWDAFLASGMWPIPRGYIFD